MNESTLTALHQQRIERAALTMTDSLYLSEVINTLCTLHRETVHAYVVDHCDGMKPGDFLASSVPSCWMGDLVQSCDLPAWDALDRLADMLASGITQTQADMAATQLAAEFDWSATMSRDEFLAGEWEIAMEYSSYRAAKVGGAAW